MYNFLNVIISPALVWFFLGFILFIAEFLAPGLILFFFAFSAILVSLLYLFIPISLDIQLLTFILLSVLSLLILRKRFKNLFYGKSLSADENESEGYVGKVVTVSTAVSKDKMGKVEFQGSYWNCISNDTLAVGDTARIIKKDNITLHVEAINKGS